jgi:Ca2+-binding RTX toxin-like protein
MAVPTATIEIDDTELAIGETGNVTITFSEEVSGFDNSDLTTANGTLSAIGSGDGGITWTATFTPSAAITDTSNIITLDNSGVTSLTGNAGSGTTDSNNYAIDTVRPTATIVLADRALAVGQTSAVTITFSEAVTGFTLADMTVTNGSLSGLSTSDNITYTATLTPSAGVNDATNLLTLNNTGVADGAGNTGTGTTESDNYVLDANRPTATIVLADSELNAGETSLVTITFSEAVTGFDNSDLTIANGTLSNVSSSDGDVTWTATFTPTANVMDTSNVIVLNNTGITDVAGNVGTGTASSANYEVKTVRPTATIVVADSELKAGETSLVTITFSEAVSGFDNADLTVEGGTLSNFGSTNGGVTWTAELTPSAATWDLTNVITLDPAGFHNGAGNTALGPISSNNYEVRTGSPPLPPEPDPDTPTGGDDVIALPSAGGTISAGAGADSISGRGGDDFVHGNTGDDSLVGGGGADIVRGGQGADFVHGNIGDDLVFGDLGDDVVHGGQGADFVQGNVGDDLVSGDLGADTVVGGQGADLVFGGEGDDYVSGDLGDDTLSGGAGADLFNFSGGAGRDVVSDFSHADGDHIRISTTDAANFTALSAYIASQGTDAVITLGAQTIVLVGVSASSLVAADFVFG